MKKPSSSKRRPTKQPMDIPADLSSALHADAAASAAFQRLPPSHQREYVEWIEEAKKEDTRRKRIEKTLAMLREKA